MLRIFVDQDFDHDSLRLRLPALDAVTALEAGLDRHSDPEILTWVAAQRRVIVTHERNTMPGFAYERVRKSEPMAGIFVISREMPIGTAIAELQVLIDCSFEGEWDQLVVFLPL